MFPAPCRECGLPFMPLIPVGKEYYDGCNQSRCISHNPVCVSCSLVDNKDYDHPRYYHETVHSISCKTACAPSEVSVSSAQSDHSLHCPSKDALDPWLPRERPVKNLIRLHE